MPSLREFSGRISIRAKRIDENADALVRKVALAVDTAVVLATPVDEGRARSNWQVGIGIAPEGTREPYYPGEQGSTEAANAQAAIDQGKRMIQRYTKGSTVHITNNLPYIQKLNDGHSAQAPAGFVEKAVVIGVAAAQGAGSLVQGAIKDEL